MNNPGKRELLNEETFKGGERVGYSPEAIMRWFLRFLGTDIEALSKGDLLNLQYEVRFVSIYGSPTTPRHPFEGFPLVRSASLDRPEEELASKRFLLSWQKSNSEALETIADKGKLVTLHFSLPPMKIKVVPLKTQHGVRWHRMLEASDPAGPLHMAISSLFTVFAHQIHRCPECRKMFMADRTNQGYCTNKCQNRAGTRRYRQSHGLITGRRRGRPPKALPVGEAEKTGKKPRRQRVY